MSTASSDLGPNLPGGRAVSLGHVSGGRTQSAVLAGIGEAVAHLPDAMAGAETESAEQIERVDAQH
jgi:hypothetical protein